MFSADNQRGTVRRIGRDARLLRVLFQKPLRFVHGEGLLPRQSRDSQARAIGRQRGVNRLSIEDRTRATLLLTEGDRKCEECNGSGEQPDETEDSATGEVYDTVTACLHCENGRLTERQNPATIDLAWSNAIRLELIQLDRFRAAIARRGCDKRGVKRQRFMLGASRFAMVEMPTVLASGPTIHLPGPAIGITATIEHLEWKNAPLAFAV